MPQCTQQKLASLAQTAAIIGGKWTTSLVLALSDGPLRFSSLQAQVGGPNPRTLSARLDDLEHAGVITKTTFAEVPPRVEYALTPKGQELIPILHQMAAWSDKHVKPAAR